MKIQPSPLELKDFAIKKCKCDVFYNDKIDHVVHFNFNIISGAESEDFAVKLEAKIKPKNKSFGGYLIEVSCLSVFEITDEASLDDKTLQNLKMISSLSIAIANLRGFLLNLTSYYGRKYMLPTIDIPSLIEEKIKEEEKEVLKIEKK